MANIPVIPGVSVATKGILNKPIKDIICAILFGGINNMLKGPLLCVNFDLNKIAEEAGLAGLGDLKAALDEAKAQLKAAEALSGIPETLARVNAAIADVQSLLALDGLCAIPLKAPKIPDVIAQVIDAEFAEMNGILNDLGRLAKPSVCLDGAGGLGFGSGYNPDSILGSLSKHLGKMGSIPGDQLAALTKRLQGVGKALEKSINRQLFPDFRTKHNLVTGAPISPADAQVITVNDFKAAAATAQTLVASMKQTGSYPADVNGIRSENIWLAMLGPEVYAMAVDAMTPTDPLFTQQDPIYDYCGKLVGYTSTVITGDITAIGGNPIIGAELRPPLTNFNLNWISDRNCWAVAGIQSEQIVNGRKDLYLNANPTIEIHRGYNHTFGIPSIDISGTGVADEFFICYVNDDLKPRKDTYGNVQLFNLGLARLETYELLEDANGSFDETYALTRKSSFPTGTTLYFAAEPRVFSGTTAPSVPSESVWWYNTETCDAKRWVPYKSYGETSSRWDATAGNEPISSPESTSVAGVWEIITTLVDVDPDNNFGTPTYHEFKHWESVSPGYWVDVNESDRVSRWFGSSIRFDAPHTNYLAYSNRDGSVYGLLKFI